MIYHQKDIVEIDFPIPGEGFKVHPALIVSNDELQVDEGFVYVALISSQDFAYSRHYAYPLSDEMLTFKMGEAELCQMSDSGSNCRYRYPSPPRQYQTGLF